MGPRTFPTVSRPADHFFADGEKMVEQASRFVPQWQDQAREPVEWQNGPSSTIPAEM